MRKSFAEMEPEREVHKKEDTLNDFPLALSKHTMSSDQVIGLRDLSLKQGRNSGLREEEGAARADLRTLLTRGALGKQVYPICLWSKNRKRKAERSECAALWAEICWMTLVK